MDDYELVMPLTWNRKWGIYYLHQPHLSAGGGIIGRRPVTAEVVTTFLNHIPGKFRFWEFNLNRDNLFERTGFPLRERTNYLLSLAPAYEEIAAGYRKDLQQNLRKAKEAHLVYRSQIPVKVVLELAEKQLSDRTRLKKEHYDRFTHLYHALENRQMATTRGVIDTKGQLLASGVFLFANGNAYYVIAGNNPEGRKTGASHLLLDQFIKE